MRLFLILLLFFSINRAKSQDTVRIYFEYGSSRVAFMEEQKLKDLAVNFYLSSVDFVEFIGYADSTGNLKSNLRLSEKRAKNVQRICQSAFNSKTEFNILAKGEGIDQTLHENRRVEVVLHYEDIVPKQDPPEIIEDVDPRCIFIDFDALKYCNMRVITKGRREYVYIEALDIGLFKERIHYYALKNYKGKVDIQRVRWKLKVTGRLWWRDKRLVALIPKASFDQYQFFTLQDAPCNGCTEEIFTKDTVIMNVQRYYPDYFILSTMQAKQRFFKQNQLKIRVPKEYVDLNETYYYDWYDNEFLARGLGQVNWTTKDFGRKNQAYYFANIETLNGRMPYIKHQRMTTECRGVYNWAGNGGYRNMGCGGMGSLRGSLNWVASIEPGVFYHNDTLTGYLAIGLTHDKFSQFGIQAGINSRLGFYGAMNYRYNLLSIRTRAFSIRDTWVDPFTLSNGNFANTLITPYIGIDLKTSYTDKYQSFLEGNLNFGLSARVGLWKAITDIYIQGGASYDFLQRINDKIYGYGQFGMRFYLR